MENTTTINVENVSVRNLTKFGKIYRDTMIDLLDTVDEEDLEGWLLYSIDYLQKMRGYTGFRGTPQGCLQALKKYAERLQ